MVIFPSNDKNTGGRSLSSLELYLDTVGGENQTLHRFGLDTLIVATENFSKANKISPMTTERFYKGKLQNGQGIAVARINISYGYKHLMNEASILVKLEHENLAKLLGYCIGEAGFMLLVYEFALYASLDRLLFDREDIRLNWDKRYKIILGVARAVLYLHRDAPVRIIHCDVQPGNILLDESLNPILSSFWDARCLAINETDCRVSRIVGTWGYMAPEYMLNGDLSTKADVYSLGVLVLEIITGHRATISDISPEYVKRSWFEGTLSNIIDARIDADSSSMTRFFEIGLLCVQKYAGDRPRMEEVVSMLLDSSSLTLPAEKMRAIRQNLSTTSAPLDDYDVDDYDTGAVGEFISELFPR